MARLQGWTPPQGWSAYTDSKYNPELAVASYRTGIPESNLQQINSWGKLYDKHRELLSMDNEKAVQEFNALDEDVQTALKETFDNPDYLNKPKDWTVLGALGKGIKTLVSSPFRFAFETALPAYSQTLSAPYNITRALGQGEFTPSMLLIWSKDWDGKKIFDKNYTSQLDATYGDGVAALAKGLTVGKTPGQVIEEVGGVTPELERALNFMQENPDKFNIILEDYRRGQISFGRDVGRFIFRLSPDAPTAQEKAFDRVSGVLDAGYQIFADPLTWATLGTWGAAKGLVKAAGALDQEALKLTDDILKVKLKEFPNTDPIILRYQARREAVEQVLARQSELAPSPTRLLAPDLTVKSNKTLGLPLLNKGKIYGNLMKKGIPSDIAVPLVFREKEVKAVWDGVKNSAIPGLGQLIKAFREGNDVVKANVIDDIGRFYPMYNDDAIIREFAEGGIEDAFTAGKYFTDSEHALSLFNAKSNSMIFYTSNNVLTANKSLRFRQNFRLKIAERFNTRQPVSEGDDLFEVLKQSDKSLDAAYIAGRYLESGQDVDKVAKNVADLRNTDPLFNLAATKMATFKERVGRYFSRHPLSRTIYTDDDNVYKSLPAFRDLAKLVLPDKQAKILTQRFADLKMNDRRVMLRALHADVYHSSGLGAIPGGTDIIQGILDDTFGSLGFISGQSLDISKGMKLSNSYKQSVSIGADFDTAISKTPSQPFQFTSNVSQPKFVEIANLLGENALSKKEDGAKVWNALRRMGAITNSHAVSTVTNTWTIATLVPKLGIRAVVDELFLFSLYAPYEIIGSFVGRARKAVKTLAVARGSAEGISFSQERFLKLQDKISPETRRAIEDLAAIEHPKDFVAQKDFVVETIINEAINELRAIPGFTSNLPSPMVLDKMDKKFLYALMRYNPMGLDLVTSSQARNAALGAKAIDVVQDVVSEQGYDAFLKANGLVKTPKLQILSESASRNQRIAGQFDIVSKRFSNDYSLFVNKGTKLDPSSLFVKHNGLRTQEDFINAGNEIVQAFGIKLPEGKDFIDAADDITTGLLTNPEKLMGPGTPVRKLLESLDSYPALKGTKSDYEIFTDWLQTHLLDLRKSFHGSSRFEVFNESLFKKVSSSKGKFNWSRLPMEEYDELVGKYDIKGELAVPFAPGPASITEAIAEYGNRAFELMDQQVTSYFRTPATMAFFLTTMRNFEEGGYSRQLKEELLAKTTAARLESTKLGKLSKEDAIAFQRHADDLAERRLSEFAIQDALNNIMKYADNPEVRTSLAWNLRNGSRFYRATEDFIRRFYRLKEHSIKTIMRMRLSAQGLAASGFIHEDAKGESYMVMPMDDMIFQVVDKPLRVLTGGTAGYNQTLVGDFTLKLSQVNPSFGPDATTPTLSGPMASMSVFLAKSVLGQLGPNGRLAADRIDNILLGDIGDNLTLRRAMVPASLDRMFRMLNSNEKDRQEISALHQVIAYNAAHGKGLPVDATPEEQYEYVKNLRISGHNLVFMRNLLGLLPIPWSPTLKESKDLPNFLKEVGITSVRQEFFDIYEGVVNNSNPRLDDPYEEALAIYIGKNPNKLVYTVSRAEKTQEIAFRKTDEVKDWYIKNADLIDKYGDAAWLAAPNVGEFSASAYGWFEASGLIDNKDFETYLKEVQISIDRQTWFDIQDEAMDRMNSTANPYERQTIADNMQMRRQMLLVQNPLLKTYLESGGFGVEKERNMASMLGNMLLDKDVEMDAKTRESLNIAFQLASNTTSKLELMRGEDASFKRIIRDEAIADLDNIANINYTVRQANRAIFVPILKSLSRDERIS